MRNACSGRAGRNRIARWLGLDLVVAAVALHVHWRKLRAQRALRRKERREAPGLPGWRRTRAGLEP